MGVSFGELEPNPVILYEYQKTRKKEHAREFLKGFSGICVTDGYQVYHSIADEREDLTIAAAGLTPGVDLPMW